MVRGAHRFLFAHTMNSIQRNLISTSPPTISMRHFYYQQGRKLARRSNPAVIGLSIGRLSPTGIVESIAFATSREILLLKLETRGGSKSSLPTLDLSRVLDKFNLVAFDMAQLTLHIFRVSRQHVRGVNSPFNEQVLVL